MLTADASEPGRSSRGNASFGLELVQLILGSPFAGITFLTSGSPCH